MNEIFMMREYFYYILVNFKIQGNGKLYLGKICESLDF